MTKKFALPTMLGACLIAHSVQADPEPIRISSASVLPQTAVAISAGAAYEMGREVAGLAYDNFRLHPLGARYGVGDGFEVGAYLSYSSNMADDDGAPDESGLEGLTVYGKTALNRHVALELGMTVAGSDDVGPYPSEGLDFFANVPMQRTLGPGVLYGEFGYRVQEVGGFFNYGFGYGLPLSEMVSINAELVGDENPLNTGVNPFLGTNGTSHLDLVMGANLRPMSNMRIAPYAAIGLYDASPDLAVGVRFDVTL